MAGVTSCDWMPELAPPPFCTAPTITVLGWPLKHLDQGEAVLAANGGRAQHDEALR
jgi:hypothetical protein